MDFNDNTPATNGTLNRLLWNLQKIKKSNDKILEALTDNVVTPPTPVVCTHNAGASDDLGLFTYCWESLDNPINNESSDRSIKVDKDGSEKLIPIENGKIQFNLIPVNGNKRTEFYIQGWKPDNPKGTEEWYGFTYGFGSDYIIDTSSEWGLWQVHGGVVDENPNIAIQIVRSGQFSGHNAGELVIVRDNGNGTNDYNFTGITPTANTDLDIVIHVIYNDNNKGVLQVWIDGVEVFSDLSCNTLTAVTQHGGNAKFGIYKWKWSNQANVNNSAALGITEMNMTLGSLRVLRRSPGDTENGNDAYDLVKPQ